MNANECRATIENSGGGFICEGSPVGDLFEGLFLFPDVTGVADETHTIVTDISSPTITGSYNIGGGQLEIPNTVVGSLPSATTVGLLVMVTDGNSDSDCVTGGVSTEVLCMSNGTTWEATGDSGAGSGQWDDNGTDLQPSEVADVWVRLSGATDASAIGSLDGNSIDFDLTGGATLASDFNVSISGLVITFDFPNASDTEIRFGNSLGGDITLSVDPQALPASSFDDVDSASETIDTQILVNSTVTTGGSEDTDMDLLVQINSVLTSMLKLDGENGNAEFFVELVIDQLGLEFENGDSHTNCAAFPNPGGGIYFDGSESIFKKCQDGTLTDLDITGGGGLWTDSTGEIHPTTTTNHLCNDASCTNWEIPDTGEASFDASEVVNAIPTRTFDDTDTASENVDGRIVVEATTTGAGSEDTDMDFDIQIGSLLTTVLKLDGDPGGAEFFKEVVFDQVGIEFRETDALTNCVSFSTTGGGIFYDDSEGVFKKCQDNVLSVLDTSSGVVTHTETFVIETATTADDLRVKATAAITLVQLDCVATGATTPSVQVMTVMECTNAAASCVSSGLTVSVSALVTNVSDSTPTDAVVDDADWWGLDTTSLTTAADLIHCTVEYTQ